MPTWSALLIVFIPTNVPGGPKAAPPISDGIVMQQTEDSPQFPQGKEGLGSSEQGTLADLEFREVRLFVGLLGEGGS